MPPSAEVEKDLKVIEAEKAIAKLSPELKLRLLTRLPRFKPEDDVILEFPKNGRTQGVISLARHIRKALGKENEMKKAA